jgi:putative PIN family toxin of toxin-antitoxin system
LERCAISKADGYVCHHIERQDEDGFLDTNVIVKAFRSPRGASAAVLKAVRLGRIAMLASPPLFFEYEQVLVREEHLQAAGATQADADGFLDALAEILTPVEVHFLWRPQLSDAEDEMVLEAAINGGAEAIVTFETATFDRAANSFGIAVVTPPEVLARMGA